MKKKNPYINICTLPVKTSARLHFTLGPFYQHCGVMYFSLFIPQWWYSVC